MLIPSHSLAPLVYLDPSLFTNTSDLEDSGSIYSPFFPLAPSSHL